MAAVVLFLLCFLFFLSFFLLFFLCSFFSFFSGLLYFFFGHPYFFSGLPPASTHPGSECTRPPPALDQARNHPGSPLASSARPASSARIAASSPLPCTTPAASAPSLLRPWTRPPPASKKGRRVHQASSGVDVCGLGWGGQNSPGLDYSSSLGQFAHFLSNPGWIGEQSHSWVEARNFWLGYFAHVDPTWVGFFSHRWTCS